jgi:hypothetical protein
MPAAVRHATRELAMLRCRGCGGRFARRIAAGGGGGTVPWRTVAAIQTAPETATES